MNLKNKKILIFGLGVLGGGVATTNWLLKKGARITITDLKDDKYLKKSLGKIKGKADLVLETHRKKDVNENEIIVFNPDISSKNSFVKLAKKLGKQIENEATLYYKYFDNPKIAVTGTRGKTTTTNWISHFLGIPVVGNSSTNPYLKMINRKTKASVTEIPSFLLELFNSSVPAPHIAVVTNIYRDHLNRYDSFEDYAKTKANIFKYQKESDYLILDYKDKWTKFLLKRKPKAQILYFSQEILPIDVNGVFHENGYIFQQANGISKKILSTKTFVKNWGEHNLNNLMAASLVANLSGVSYTKTSKMIHGLPQIPFRLETIYKDKKIEIVNDTTATSPEGGIAAINKFASPHCVLLSGGTDRNLEFKEWAKIAGSKLKKENTLLLKGSATDKMLKYLKEVKTFDSFEDYVADGLKRALGYRKSVLLFSPASKSFEKFKNEYDRGEQFNDIIKRNYKTKK